jgi:hypothetical protein
LEVGDVTAVVGSPRLRAGDPLRFLEALCLVFLLVTAAQHFLAVQATLRRWRPAVHADGDLMDLLGTLETLATLDTDVRRKGKVDQLLQLSGKLCLLAANATYAALLYINLTLRVPATFVIYHHLFAAARFLLVSKRAAGMGGSSPCGADVPGDAAWDAAAPPLPRWALADDARGLRSLLGTIQRLEQLASLCSLYQLLASLVSVSFGGHGGRGGEGLVWLDSHLRCAGHFVVHRWAAAAHGQRQQAHAIRGGHCSYRRHRANAPVGAHPAPGRPPHHAGARVARRPVQRLLHPPGRGPAVDGVRLPGELPRRTTEC